MDKTTRFILENNLGRGVLVKQTVRQYWASKREYELWKLTRLGDVQDKAEKN